MRILVVEDEHKIAGSIKKGLELENYAVDVAYNGLEGYDLASTEEYDAIILDLMLPLMQGFEVCSKLRQKNINTPIIILTAKGQLHDKIQGLDLGADDYITKPFSFEELVARVRALTRRPKEMLNVVLQVGDLVLNTSTYLVTRAGLTIDLSGKEFSFLEYLMRNPNKILTRDQIVSHVWDYDAEILPNTVEAYIKNLRKKIDVPFKERAPLINTVRGFGYMLGNKHV